MAVAPFTSEISLGGSDTYGVVLTERAVSVCPHYIGRFRRLTICIPKTSGPGRGGGCTVREVRRGGQPTVLGQEQSRRERGGQQASIT